MLIFLAIVIFILIVPIPIKFNVKYVEKKLNIYLYNINIMKKIDYLKKKASNKHQYKKKSEFNFKNLKLVINLLDNNKFKPILRFKLNFTYGLNDAACTAVSYGLISSLYPLALRILNCFFKIKKQYINILPDLNKPFFKLKLDSIIFVSFAKVIYIVFIIYKLKLNKI